MHTHTYKGWGRSGGWGGRHGYEKDSLERVTEHASLEGDFGKKVNMQSEWLSVRGATTIALL